MFGIADSARQVGYATSLVSLGNIDRKSVRAAPSGFVLATKVDPVPGSSDFSGNRVRASVTESLESLGLDRRQVVYLHDPEKMTFAEGTAHGGAVQALVQLRKEGVIDHLGVAGGPIDLMLL